MAKNPAVVAITINGLNTAKKLEKELNADIYTAGHASEYGIHMDVLSNCIENLFKKYKAIIFIMALGAVVRLIAPYLKNKFSDPAVIAIDDSGKFIIPVISGHHGANELAVKIAAITGGTAVITTASDVYRLNSPEVLASKFGMKILNRENLTRISADIVGGSCVNIINETCLHINEVKCEFYKWSIYITYKSNIPENSLVLIPKVLSIGIGFSTDADFNDMRNAILKVFNKYEYSIDAIESLSTIDIKKDNDSLSRLAEIYSCRVNFYSAGELNKFATTQSLPVYNATGAYSVCNAAARISSKNGTELVSKEIINNVTVSVFLNAC